MATQASAHPQPASDSGGPSLSGIIDRWIYVMMVVFLIAVILIGFVPDSFTRMAAIQAGERPPFLPQAHFHALTMGSWMLLLLTQTVLMATGRRQWHMQLGMLGLVLAPLLVIAGFMLATANFGSQIAFAEAGSPEVRAQLDQRLANMSNVVLMQIRAGIGFLLLVPLALLARRTDPGTHKRLMILTVIPPLGAATSRITFLYNTAPDSPAASLLWPLACALPMFLWDLYRQRSIHRAYWIFAAIMLPTGLAVQLLWNSPWWHGVVAQMIGR
ncbi:MAG: hypothetical protein ACO25F_02265 [Erythrobacter sp.]